MRENITETQIRLSNDQLEKIVESINPSANEPWYAVFLTPLIWFSSGLLAFMAAMFIFDKISGLFF